LAVTHIRVESEEAAARIGKPQGRFVSVDCGNLCELDALAEERVCRVLAVEIREMAQNMCKKRVGSDFSVLVVGLGNAEMTPDALGAKTVKTLPVTRHFAKEGVLLQGEYCSIGALCPGVVGQTGIEVAEILSGVVKSVMPDLVVAVDALAARSPARLCGTVQLADNGIQPGGGVGNPRRPLTRESIGVPVMALGVPTVINCAALLRDAVSQEVKDLFTARARELRSFFVCPKEIDLLVGRAGAILARALEKAFHL
jgi:spore protease